MGRLRPFLVRKLQFFLLGRVRFSDTPTGKRKVEQNNCFNYRILRPIISRSVIPFLTLILLTNVFSDNKRLKMNNLLPYEIPK